jgi:methylmalonyl-CoA mutase
MIILETSGIGQSDTEIIDHSDVSLYVMTPEYGAATQLEKIDMLDFADIIALNKFDKRGAADALTGCQKTIPTQSPYFLIRVPMRCPFSAPSLPSLMIPEPIICTGRLSIASSNKQEHSFKSTFEPTPEMSEKVHIIPPKRTRYLSEISENNRGYDRRIEGQVKLARKLYGLRQTIDLLSEEKAGSELKAGILTGAPEHLRRPAQRPRRRCLADPGRVEREESSLYRRRVCLSGAKQRYSSKNVYRIAFSLSHSTGGSASLSGLG